MPKKSNLYYEKKAGSIFDRMVKDGFFSEPKEIKKPKTIKQVTSLLKDAMNGASEESYKALKGNYVFDPDIRKQFTSKEICNFANYVDRDFQDNHGEEVFRILKDKKVRCKKCC